MKILVADDDVVSRTKMEAIVEQLGTCKAVECGKLAVAAYKEALESGELFELITLDVAMPDMNGTQVLSKIREMEEKKKIPEEKQATIIMISSHSDKKLVLTCFHAGCDAYIVKPFDITTLIKKLEEIESKGKIHKAATSEIKKGLEQKNETTTQQNSAIKTDKMKILVVDDEDVSRTKMEAIVEELGACEAVENGTKAIDVFKEALEKNEPFGLITLDIVMPDMKGTEVLSIIRKMETEKKVPDEKRAIIIMVTSHSDKELVVACLRAGCNGYIVKPFDITTLIKKLEEIESKGR